MGNKSNLKQALEKTRSSAAGGKHPVSYDEPAVEIEICGGKKAVGKMTAVINEMCKSPAGKMILELAADEGYDLCFDPETVRSGQMGYTSPGEMSCALNPNNTLEQNIATLAHELRHVYQYSFPFTENISCVSHDTRTNLHRERTMEADAEGYCCLVAWELKEQGLDGCWNTMAAEFPSVTSPFEKTLKETGDINQARTAAFLGWYDDSVRRNTYDEPYAQELEEMKAGGMHKKLKSVNVKKMIEAYCCDPDQTDSYFTQDPAILNSGKYLALYADVKERIEKKHNKLTQANGTAADKTIAGLSAEQRPPAKKSCAKAVSDTAKKIKMDNKLKQVSRIIGSTKAKKDSSALGQALLYAASANAR